MIVRLQNIEFVMKENGPVLLKENGYIFEIKKLKVRVGNILTCLERLLLLAKNTSSLSRLGKFKSNGIINIENNIEFDFRSRHNNNCNKLIATDGNYINNFPFHDDLFIDENKECLRYLKSIVNRCSYKESVNKNTLVIHIRSGDIFRKRYPRVHPEFYQPPLSYYDSIIRNGGYDDILILTEQRNMNPVIKHLLKKYRGSRLSSGNLISDINIMIEAENFVCARSTLSFIISRMNENLKNVYVWKDGNHGWSEWIPNINNSLSKDLVVITYSASDYMEVGEWRNDKIQNELMLLFPEESLVING